MSNRQKFENDLTVLLSRLTSGVAPEVENKLNMLKDWLIKLQKENVVKINHSVMELVVPNTSSKKATKSKLNIPLNEILTCDLYGIKGLGNLIVEIETGFIPPENALAPLTYTTARLASKIIRYSSFAGKFATWRPTPLYSAFPTHLSQTAKKPFRPRN